MSNWRNSGTVPYERWHDTIIGAGGPELLAARSSYDAAGQISALALAMLDAESSYGTRFNRNKKENQNPLNLRPPGGDGYSAYPSYAAAIRAWRERLTSDSYKGGVYRDTETLDDLIRVYAPGSDNNDEAAYVATIRTLWQAWGVEESSMAIVAQECPVEIRVLTGPSVNRPALAMPDASFVTVHEVGNTAPGADEDMHADFVHNGGGENAVSFHFVNGPSKIIQLVYLNENAWHASDSYSGRGNRDSIAIENIQIGDFGATLDHLAWLIAELFRNPSRFAWRGDVGRFDDLDPALAMERIKQHNFWAPDHKNCPQFMRERGLWLPLLEAVKAELAGTVPDLPNYTAPVLPNWWSEAAVLNLRNQRADGILYKPLGTRVTATKRTGAYADPLKGTKWRTRADIEKGETVDLRYRYTHPTSKQAIGITRHGTHVYLRYFSPTIILRNTGAE